MIFWLIIAAAAVTPFVFLPFTVDMTGVPKVTFIRILALAILVVWAAKVAVTAKFILPRGRLAVALATFVGFIGLSVLFSIDRNISFFGRHLAYMGLVTYLSLAVIAAAGWLVFRKKERRLQLAWAVASAATIISFLALLQSMGIYSNLWDIGPAFGNRGYATLGNPDFLGLYLCAALALAIGLFFEKPVDPSSVMLTRIMSGFYSVAILGGILSTGSLGAFIGAAVAAAAFAFLWWSHGNRTRRIAGLLSLIAVVGASLFILTSGLTPASQDSGAKLRLLVWPATLSTIAERPIFGTGIEALHYELPSRMKIVPGEHNRFTPEDSHNYFMTLAASAGLPALGAFLALLIIAYSQKPNQELDLTQAAALAAIAGYLAAAFFNPDDIAAAALFWILIGSLGGATGNIRSLRLGAAWRLAGAVVATAATVLIAFSITPVMADSAYRDAQDSTSVDQALANINRAVELAPYDEWYRQKKAETLVAALSGGDRRYVGRAIEASRTTGPVPSLPPISYTSYIYSGLAKYYEPRVTGQPPSSPATRQATAAARKDFKQALRLNPASPDARYYLFVLARESGDTPEAVARAKSYLELGLQDGRESEAKAFLR